MRLMTFLIAMIFFLVEFAYSQYQEAGKYFRKTVLHTTFVIPLDNGQRNLSSHRMEEMSEMIDEELQMGRFDFLELPESLTNELALEDFSDGLTAPESLCQRIEDRLIPGVKSIFEQTKNLKKQSLLTEAQRNSKLAIKAKELGLTSTQLKSLLNSAYFYIPFLESATRITTKKSITWGLSVGVIWYRIWVTENTIRTEKVITSGTVFGYAKKENKYLGYHSADDFAFSSALKAAVKNLKLKVMNLAAFRLTAQVLEKNGWSAGMDIGKQEGIRLDDKFYVIEEYELPDGKIKKRKTGYGFVSTVVNNGNNPDAMSKLHLISGVGNTEPGMTLREHPRSGINFSLGYTNLRLPDQVNQPRLFFDEFQGVEAALHFNFGRYLGLNQTFFDLGGMGAGGELNVSDPYLSVSKTYQANLWQLHTAILKKYYFSRLALAFNGGILFRWLQIHQYNDTNILYNQYVGGLFGRVALELSLGIDFNLMVYAGYNNLGQTNSWYSDEDMTKPDWEINHNSWQFGTGIVWSLPTLPFDPFSLIRAVTGF